MIKPLKQINNIYGYVRVSTKEQVRSGVSIDVQQQQISEFVKEKYNREVTDFFVDDGVSGTMPILERGGSRGLTDVIDQNDIVICTRLIVCLAQAQTFSYNTSFAGHWDYAVFLRAVW